MQGHRQLGEGCPLLQFSSHIWAAGEPSDTGLAVAGLVHHARSPVAYAPETAFVIYYSLQNVAGPSLSIDKVLVAFGGGKHWDIGPINQSHYLRDMMHRLKPIRIEKNRTLCSSYSSFSVQLQSYNHSGANQSWVKIK